MLLVNISALKITLPDKERPNKRRLQHPADHSWKRLCRRPHAATYHLSQHSGTV